MSQKSSDNNMRWYSSFSTRLLHHFETAGAAVGVAIVLFISRAAGVILVFFGLYLLVWLSACLEASVCY
jgi:uncharacterized membrane protein